MAEMMITRFQTRKVAQVKQQQMKKKVAILSFGLDQSVLTCLVKEVRHCQLSVVPPRSSANTLHVPLCVTEVTFVAVINQNKLKSIRKAHNGPINVSAYNYEVIPSNSSSSFVLLILFSFSEGHKEYRTRTRTNRRENEDTDNINE